MTSTEFEKKVEIDVDIDRISKILDSGIFSIENIRNPLRESAFIEIVIRLQDLLYKCDAVGARVSFTDDIIPQTYKDIRGKDRVVNDITDAVTYIRNAACHIESELNFYDIKRGMSFVFNTLVGKGIFISTPEGDIKSDYADDMCFFYGGQRLYFKRHIIRAFEEAKEALER